MNGIQELRCVCFVQEAGSTNSNISKVHAEITEREIENVSGENNKLID